MRPTLHGQTGALALPLVSENDNVSVTTSIFQQPTHQRRSAQLLIAWRQKHNNAIFLTVQVSNFERESLRGQRNEIFAPLNGF